jgi:NAD(P)-dependent dehydrogenase (short-subunit alcohol dehydrogenase family)
MRLVTALGAGVGALAGFALAHQPSYGFEGRVVLITGGSRGLGLVMARQLVHEHGARVVLVARSADALARAAQDLKARGAVHTIVGDVRSREDAARIVDQALARFGRIDVLINNAGVIVSAPFDNTADEDFRNSLAVHFWGVLHMSRAVLPHLPRPDGRIVNICSIGGKLAVPHLAAYCAGKFAQAGLSSVMGEELRSEGVVVSTVYPGLMRTGSYVNAQFRGQVSREFAVFALASSLPGISMGADRAVRQILQGVRAGRREIVIPWATRQISRVAALAPNAMLGLFSAVNAMLPAETRTVGPAKVGADLPLPQPIRLATALGSRAAERNNEKAS